MQETLRDYLDSKNVHQEEPKSVQEIMSLGVDGYQAGGDHYKKMATQPWEVMEAILTEQEFAGYLKGCIIKYSMREGKKDGSDDHQKLIHYIAKLKDFGRHW